METLFCSKEQNETLCDGPPTTQALQRVLRLQRFLLPVQNSKSKLHKNFCSAAAELSQSPENTKQVHVSSSTSPFKKNMYQNETIERITIRPEVHALKELHLKENSSYILNGFDYAYCKMRPPYYCFRFDATLDPNELKQGLQAVVNECPILATKLDPSIFPFRFVDFNTGVPFNVKTVVSDDPDLEKLLPSCDHKMEEWAKTGIYELMLPEEEIPFLQLSMMAVAVIIYPKQNVTYIGIMRQHAVGDGSAACTIFHRWSYLTAKLANKMDYLNEINIKTGEVPLRHSRTVYSDDDFRRNSLKLNLPTKPLDYSYMESDKFKKYFNKAGESTLFELRGCLERMKVGGKAAKKLRKLRMLDDLAQMQSEPEEEKVFVKINGVKQKKHLSWLEMRLDMNQIEKLKASLLETLSYLNETGMFKNNITWFSRFEVIAGIMLASKIKALQSVEPTQQNLAKGLTLPERCFFTFNTRKPFKDVNEVAGNTVIGTAAYKLVGNEFQPEFLTLLKDKDLSSSEFVALCASYFHNTLREEIAKREQVCAEVDLVHYLPNVSALESNFDLQQAKFINLTTLSQFSKENKGISLNSWAGFDWLEVNFGHDRVSRMTTMTRKKPGFGNFWFQFQAGTDHFGGLMSFLSEDERDLVKREMNKLVCLNGVVSIL